MSPLALEFSASLGGIEKNAGRSLVLVVDDHKEVLRFIQIDLEFRGFDVITTTSGTDALKLVESEKPNIMLLDVVMPVMDGFEVLRRLRAYSRLPVIAFSASEENEYEAISLGADDFMKKPFYPNELASRIRRILS